MAGSPESVRQSTSPRKRVASIVLLVFSVGFLFLGSVGLTLGLRSTGTLSGSELVVGGAVAIAIGCFLLLCTVALLFDKTWLGQWN